MTIVAANARIPRGNVLRIVVSPELAVQTFVPLQAFYHHCDEESSEEFVLPNCSLGTRRSRELECLLDELRDFGAADHSRIESPIRECRFDGRGELGTRRR